MYAPQHADHVAHAMTARVRTANLACAALTVGAWSKSNAIPAYFGTKPTPPRRPSVPA
jgi:hypothetical protein